MTSPLLQGTANRLGIRRGNARYDAAVCQTTGRCEYSLILHNIEGTPVSKDVSGNNIATCAVASGARVYANEGTRVAGVDMYGDYHEEVVGSAGHTFSTFYAIHAPTDDMRWKNDFGLAYVYRHGADVADNVTIEVPADNGDNRGTFSVSDLTSEQVVQFRYVTDPANMFGTSYVDRAEEQEPDFFASACLAIDNGLVILDLIEIEDGCSTIMLNFADNTSMSVENKSQRITHKFDETWYQARAQLFASRPHVAVNVTTSVTKNVQMIVDDSIKDTSE